MLRKIARPMLASVFVVDGADMLRNTDKHSVESEQVLSALRKVLPQECAKVLPQDPELFTRAMGGTKASAGALLALGKAPRTSAAVLAATTLPAMLVRNNFWAAKNQEEKENQRSKFLVDTALLGALFITTQDTEGKPGITWRAQHASKQLQKKLPAKNEQNEFIASVSNRTNEFATLAQEKAKEASERAQEASSRAQAYVDDNKDSWAETAQGLLSTAKSYVDEAKNYYTDNKEDWLKAAQDNAQLARTAAVKNATKAQAKADAALAKAQKKKTLSKINSANVNAEKLQKKADKAIASAMKKVGNRLEA